MSKQYIKCVEGVYRLAGTCVSLDSIVYAFWRGQTAESIAHSFPVLTLEHVYGITWLTDRKSVPIFKPPKVSSRHCGRRPVTEIRCFIKGSPMRVAG
jgi:hypothetical protein